MSGLGRVGVIGAGTMGRAIAETAATSGLDAVLVRCRETGAAAVARAREEVARSLDREVAYGRLSPQARDAALDRLQLTDDRDALAGCDIILEAVVDALPCKQAVLADVERRVRASAVLATNTASLRVADVGAALRHPARLLGILFEQPLVAADRVALALTRHTAPFAVERAHALVTRMGKTWFVVADGAPREEPARIE